jgi:hypothetical protein
MTVTMMTTGVGVKNEHTPDGPEYEHTPDGPEFGTVPN